MKGSNSDRKSVSDFAARNLAARLLFGIATVLLYVCTEFWSALGQPWGPGVSTSLAYAFFGVHLLLSGRRLSALDPVAWIPVSMLLFYFGMPVCVEILHPKPPDYDAWLVGISPSLSRGFTALLMAFVAFIWGIHLAGLRDLPRSGRATAAPDRSLAAPALVMTMGALLMIMGGIALVGPSIVFGAYEDWWAAKGAGADARFVDVGIIFCMSGVFALIASDDPRQPIRRYFAFFIAALLAFFMIQKGDRAGLIGLGIGAGWCYTQRIRRIRPATALVTAVIALMAMPALKEFRHTKSIAESRETGPRVLLADAFYEMGSSANAMIYTLDLIPRSQGYAYGITFVDAILQAIPNFGLTPGKSFVLYGIGREAVYGTRISPSAWITEQMNPGWWDQGGGYGYAMAAEWYYNFGMPAVLLAMTFFGWLTGRIRNGSSSSALVLVASALYFGAMSGYVRNVIGHPLKVVLWPVSGLFLIRGAFRLLSRPSARHHATAPAELPRTPGAGWAREE